MDSDGIEKARYANLLAAMATKGYLVYHKLNSSSTTTQKRKNQQQQSSKKGGGSRPPRSQVGNQTKSINYLRLK